MIARGAAAVLEWYLPRRRRALERVAREACAVQEATVLALVRRARETEFGRAHAFEGIHSVSDYQARVPVADYATFRSRWLRVLLGGQDLTWPGRPRYWVKTSGTTAGGKILPITPKALASHRKGGWDAMLMATERAGAAALLGGSLLFPGGSSAFTPIGEGGLVGDLSGLVVRIDAVAARACREDVRLLCGMPSWILALFDRVARARALAGRPLGTIDECWPVSGRLLGDTVRFVARDPLRLQITGRTRHFVNAFGENVIVEEVERAVVAACRRAHAEVVEFTVAPRYPSPQEPRGGHDWLVEFAEPPRCPLDVFTWTLDETLMAVNADYRAKRAGSVGMVAPCLVELPAGTFYRWMRGEGKLGNQHKVPRVTNDRALAERLLASAAAARSAMARPRPVATA